MVLIAFAAAGEREEPAGGGGRFAARDARARQLCQPKSCDEGLKRDCRTSGVVEGVDRGLGVGVAGGGEGVRKI